MLKVKVNNKEEFSIEFIGSGNFQGRVEGKDFVLDLKEIKPGSFHILKDNKSFNVEVVKADYSEKTFTLSVNGNKYKLKVKDKFDELLHTLGLDTASSGKINEVRAPMPGMVLEIKIAPGGIVKKGDALIVLEAMKMENILKSPADGVVKEIMAKKGIAVEKNQVLIRFV